MKKAMSDQFNWIFVIIAGAVILLFFFSMIQKQQSLTIAKTDASIIRQVETIISVAGSEKETITTKELPNIDITIQCKKRGNACDCNYKSGTMDRPYDDKIIYSPRKITGTQMHIWTRTWEQPFRITNIVYTTNDRHQYIIVYNGNDDISKKIGIPERLKVKIVGTYTEAKNMFDQTAESVNILCWEDNYNCPVDGNTGQYPFVNDAPNKKVVVRVDDTQLKIATKNGGGTKIYTGIPQLIGALFSSDTEMYECNTRKSFERLTSTAEIQKKRITTITTMLTPQTGQTSTRPCSTLYTTIPTATATTQAGTANALDAIKNAAEELRKDISAANNNHAQTIKGYNDPIKGANEKMVLNGCPSIY